MKIHSSSRIAHIKQNVSYSNETKMSTEFKWKPQYSILELIKIYLYGQTEHDNGAF